MKKTVELKRFGISAKPCVVTSNILVKQISAVDLKGSKMLEHIVSGNIVACINENEYGFYVDLKDEKFQGIKNNYDKAKFINIVSDELVNSVIEIIE